MSRQLPDDMHWQIYQAYRQGPNTLFRLFEATFGKLALCGEPDPDMPQRQIDDLSEHLGRLKSQLAKLQAEVSDLHQRNFQLQRRNSELEVLLTKDSHHSSRPPSTDAPWAKRTRNLRSPSGKRPGGQAGHRGETLRLSSHPNRVVVHRPRQCHRCHASLASASVISHYRQQVFEVVPARLRVTEHRLAMMRCPACRRRAQGEFVGGVGAGVQYGPGVKARLLYLQQYQLLPYQRTSEAMRELCGCPLWAGTVANIVTECADKLVAT